MRSFFLLSLLFISSHFVAHTQTQTQWCHWWWHLRFIICIGQITCRNVSNGTQTNREYMRLQTIMKAVWDRAAVRRLRGGGSKWRLNHSIVVWLFQNYFEAKMVFMAEPSTQTPCSNTSNQKTKCLGNIIFITGQKNIVNCIAEVFTFVLKSTEKSECISHSSLSCPFIQHFSPFNRKNSP